MAGRFIDDVARRMRQRTLRDSSIYTKDKGCPAKKVVIRRGLVERFRYAYAAIAGIGVVLAVVAYAVACQAQSPVQPPACNETGGRVVSDTVPSQIYGSPVAVAVYLPRCYEMLAGGLPVIYLLHGANTDQTQWPDLNLQLSADDVISRSSAPFVVVIPGGEYREGADYGAFVLNDLLPAIAHQYKVSTRGEERAIGGISMGGYWALRLAFQHPQLFAAAGGHSPVVSGNGADDPLDLARTAPGLEHLRVWLDAGDADPLRTSAADLAAALRARFVPVTFSVNPGEHNRTLWRAHSEEYLSFYAGAVAHPACLTNFVGSLQWWFYTISPFHELVLDATGRCPL